MLNPKKNNDASDSRAASTISAQTLAALGLNELAFLKPVVDEGKQAIGIFSANGIAIGVAPDRATAAAAAIQHDMVPVSVH
jgi:hypothetical protein